MMAGPLIVIDYAEARVEQLDVMLLQLAVGASEQHPVRVLLMMRARAGARRCASQRLP